MVWTGRIGRLPLLVVGALGGLAGCGESGSHGSTTALAALSIFVAGIFFFVFGSLLLGRLFQRRSRRWSRRPRPDHEG